MELIPGLCLVKAFLVPEEQAQFLEIVDSQLWLTDLKRRVQHYGYRYDYKTRSVDASMRLGTLPDWAAGLAKQLHDEGYTRHIPDQLIVNEYAPGQGIAPHVDCIPCFEDTIISLSLGAECVMTFSHLRFNAHVPILLEAGSILIIRDEARYDWKHGIAARKSDVYNGRKIVRGRRVSLTFRNVLERLQSDED